MPITFSCQDADDFITVKYAGKITGDDLIAAWKAFLEDEKFTPGNNYFIDVSDADLSKLTGKGLHDYVAYLEQFIAAQGQGVTVRKSAIYAPDTLAYGIARMYDALGIDTAKSIRVFKDKQDAINWLGNNAS